DSGTDHLGEDGPIRPSLLPPPVLRAFIHQRVDWVAVPRFALPSDREFGDLFMPDADMTKPVRSIPLYAVQVSVLIRQLMLVGPVEDGELLIQAQARQPLGRVRACARPAVMLRCELILVPAPPGPFAVDHGHCHG